MKQKKQINILLVDDCPSNLILLAEILNTLDEITITAHSGQEALEHLHQKEFAVIILDVSMPNMNGFQLAESIRTLSKNQHTPIIFLTEAEFSETIGFKGYELGAVDYLHKPINPQILLSKVLVFVNLFIQKQYLKQQEEILGIFAVPTELELKHQRIEKGLRESEVLYRDIFNSISDCIFVTDKEEVFTFISPNTENIFGYSPQEIEQMQTIDQLLGNNLFEKEKLVASGEITNIEKVILDKFGEQRVLLINVKHLCINKGTILYSCREISNYKQAEAAMAKREQYLIALVEAQQRLLKLGSQTNIYSDILEPLGQALEASGAFIIEIHQDQQGNIVSTKTSEWSAFGIESTLNHPNLQFVSLKKVFPEIFHNLIPDTIITKTFSECTSIQQSYLASLNVKSFLALPLFIEEKSYGFVGFSDCKQERKWKPLEIEMLRSGAVSLALAIGQRKMEEALKNSEERQRNIVTTMTDGLIVMNQLGKIYFVNPAVEAFFGLKADELIGSQCNFSLKDDSKELVIEQSNGKVIIIEIKIETTFWNEETVYLISFHNITERKKIEKQLYESLKELSSFKYALDKAAIIAITNPRGVITNVNNKFCEIFEYNREELIGQTHRIVNSNYHSTKFFKELWSTISQGRIWRGEIKNKTKSGQYYWMDTTIVPFLNEKGKPWQYLAIRYDITERKQAEEALRDREEQFRQLAENIRDVFLIHDAHSYQLLYMSPSFEKIWGITREEVYQDAFAWMNMIHPEDWEQVITKVKQEQQGVPSNMEYRIIKPEEEIRWIRSRSFPVFNDSQQIYRIVGITEDITERKQAEQSIKESEQRYRNLITNLHAGVVVHSPNTEILLCNSKAMELLELTREQMLEKTAIDPYWQFLKEDGTVMSPQEYPVNRVIATQQPFNNYVMGIYRPRSQTLMWALVDAFPEFDDHGQLRQVVVTFLDITQRKQAEEALKNSERRYATLAKAAPVGIFQTDAQGNYLYVNERWQAIAGLTQEQVLGQGWTKAIYPDDRQRVDQQWKQAIQYQLPFKAEYRFQHSDGIISWVYGQAVCEIDNQDTVIGYVGTITDISEQQAALRERKKAEFELQKLNEELELRIEERTYRLHEANQQLRQEVFEREQAELALKDSEERFRAIFEQAAVGIVQISLKGNFLKVNPKFCQMLGYKPEELQKTTAFDITHCDYVNEMPLYFEQLLSGKLTTLNLEKRYLRQTGESIWANLTISLVRKSSGEPDYFIKVIEDISTRKAAEEALRENQAFLRNVIDTVPSIIFVKDTQSRYTLANHALAKIHDTTVEKIEGKSDADFIANLAERNQYWSDEQQVMTSLQTLFIPEETLTLATGEVRYFQTIKTPLISADGKAYHILVVATDITERKQIEQQLEIALAQEKELHELKNQFIDLISHEFRTPLTAILGSAELLERHGEHFSLEKKQKHLRNVIVAGRRLNELVEDVLSISRAESGKMNFKPRALDVQTFCNDLIEEILFGIGKNHQIELIIKGLLPDPKLNLIYLDEKLLRHILTNLLSNAIKYSTIGSRIELSLECQGQQIIFQVSDQGIGIPVEDQSHLFESFYRANNVGNITGTGLGLKIVQTYVTLHGGKIDLMSQVGVGTAFTVALPRNKNLQNQSEINKNKGHYKQEDTTKEKISDDQNFSH